MPPIPDRYLLQPVRDDLAEKMVFLGGPRQVGKTTFAKRLAATDYPGASDYLNWDNANDRLRILHGKYANGAKLLIFDELHKYRRWKTYIKGEFDVHKDEFRFLVTGSARLDVYRRGGDSLMGRYRHYRLHPLSVAELCGAGSVAEPFTELVFPTAPQAAAALTALLRHSGFPEPFLRQTDRALRLFHADRTERLVREDIRDVENIRELSLLETMVALLPSKVGSPFSLNGLREDLGVSHPTAANWADILERFYYLFRVYPFQSTLIKSLRKEPKAYLWDWTQVEGPGPRLENVVGSHLLKFVHFLRDYQGHDADLSYLRDAEGREVDFLVTVGRKPWFAVEVKTGETKPSTHLRYFASKLKIPFCYQVTATHADFQQDGVRVMPAEKFLAGLA